MRLKTASTHKESTYGEIQRHKEQIKSLLKNLKTYFHGAVRNMVTGAKVSVSIVNRLLFSREKGEECLEEFIEKQLASREKGFYEPIKRSGIQTTIEKKEKPREVSILKEDRQALGLFVAKYPGKKEAFSYSLTNYRLALSTVRGTLYKPLRKHLFRNY